MTRVPFHSLGLLFPRTIARSLEELRESGLVAADEVPNLWQIQLGVLRMWHRVFYRPESIGTSKDFAVRDSWRARLLERRPLRFPFLMRQLAIHPLDFSGLASSTLRIHRHLLGAHHDGVQFLYDLQLLRMHDGSDELLRAVRDEARAVVDGTHPRAEWLRDLVVYERYHENLLAAVESFLDGTFEASPEERANPDIDFVAYVRFCARQPETPADTLKAFREGRYTIADGIRDMDDRVDASAPLRAVARVTPRRTRQPGPSPRPCQRRAWR